MFLEKLLNTIGQFFAGLFNAAGKTWKHLSPEVQQALIHGSAIIDVINKNIDAAPSFIIDILQKEFPDITIENLHSGLSEISKGLNIAEGINDPDLPTLISNLQIYLSKQKGKIWDGVSHALASLLAVVLAPPETKFAAISSLMEYVYHRFIKKDK